MNDSVTDWLLAAWIVVFFGAFFWGILVLLPQLSA